MKYNPNKPISDEELDKLSESDLFEYLDGREKYLRETNTIKPLGQYEAKHFAAFSKAEPLTTEELRRAKEIGKEGDDAVADTIKDAMEKFGGDPKLRDPGIKNIKTCRRQWFD